MNTLPGSSDAAPSLPALRQRLADQGVHTLLVQFTDVHGAPKGKWRQTSFYREPNGPGNGRLVYTKVRIAPFGNPECALQMAGTLLALLCGGLAGAAWGASCRRQ